MLTPPVAGLLRRCWLTSSHKGTEDLVFCRDTGRGMDYREVAEDFRAAVTKAGLHGHGRLALHSFRHGIASMLIAAGSDVVFVSRQLGKANPTMTFRTYAHLFARPRAR